ncbi:WD40 repeat-like protein [Lactarius akahatsu]|uniref:WD40 repeat-like protein n=1 Tax=Lactarius akahatsu TaxID=416441 RepID=A0AAD4LMQ3_9AGAM|nr:WD40 repeat-like protein [Lactarius akahatsu]
MAPPPPRRRVSYVIPFPPPTSPVPRLSLPPLGFDRHGSINPVLIPNFIQHPQIDLPTHQRNIPRHRLGVSSLALDTTTQLLGRPTPEGILYTGGRDGLVIAWDLNISMRQRVRKRDVSRRRSTRWELITGWGDEVVDDTLDEDKDLRSDGDILGEVKGSSRRRGLSSTATSPGFIPFEHQWEGDIDAFRPGRPSTFRQAAQIHSDWVNDILLCNQNKTLISASSDGTVKAWNPHSSPLSDPTTVGTHTDYVRCLAHSREQGWIASGSFDRTIKLWDLSRSSQAQPTQPIMTFSPPESSGAKASVYALAVDPQGHMVASGGPERVIRMWDPRAGRRIGKLVGHTDNIRAILISEDARCLLTASADASVKLWSLTSQRCLHTFTHHTDSVWALHSSHPSLEIFYSGDKSGYVAKIDVEGYTDMSEGECVLVCQDVAPPAEGVTKLVALDDLLVWTASGSSNLRRWHVPPRRAVRAAALIETMSSVVLRTTSRLRPSRSAESRPRSITLDLPPSPPLQRPPRHTSSMSTTSSPGLEPPPHVHLEDGTGEGETTWYGLPYDCLVHLASPLNDPFTPFSPVYRGNGTGADADVATLYSAASLMSVSARPVLLRTPLRGIFPSPPSPTQSPASLARPASPAHSDFSPSIGGLGTGGLGSGGVGSAGTGGATTGLGRHRTEFESREVVADAQPFSPTPDFVLVGAPGLVRGALLSNRVHALTVDTAGTVAVWDIIRALCVGQFAREDVVAASTNGSDHSHDDDWVCSPREALDIVRERIDGEAVVVSWSAVDTSTGVLNVHLDEHAFDAELYADELGCTPDRPLPAGVGPEDMRINLGKWILRNLFQGFIREEQHAHAWRLRTGGMPPLRAISNFPAAPPPSSKQDSAMDSEGNTNAINTSSVVIVAPDILPALPPNSAGPDVTCPPIPHSQPTSPTSGPPTTPNSNETMLQLQPTVHQRAQTEMPTTAGTASHQEQDYFGPPVRRPSVSSGGASGVLAATTPEDPSGATGTSHGPAGLSTPGGLMGKLRGLGRATKRSQSESTPGTPVPPSRTPGTPAMGPAAASPATVPCSQTATPIAASHETSARREQAPPAKLRTAAQAVLASGPLSPPTSADGPTLALAPDIPLLVAEERAHGWAIVYRGTVSSAGTVDDVEILEDAMPFWLLEYLLLGRAPQVGVVKIGFMLLPLQSGVPGDEVLPELVNTSQTKLSASRFLRIRKLAAHVQDKIEKMSVGTRSAHPSPRSSMDAHGHSRAQTSFSPTPIAHEHQHRPPPEDLWEIVCNDTVLPINMTLAAVRQYVWRQSGEVVLYYRRRRPSAHREDQRHTTSTVPSSLH